MAPQTEKRRFELALHCLEQAVNSTTGEPEAIAGVLAYRRKTPGKQLSEVLTMLYPYRSPIGFGMAEYQREWKAQVENQNGQIADLAAENLRLEAIVTRLSAELEGRVPKNTEKQPRPVRRKAKSAPKTATPRASRKSTKRGPNWTPPEMEFLIRIHTADVTISNRKLGALCTEEFGREITYEAICGKLDRLRNDGKIPEYRPGRKPKKHRRFAS